MADDRALRRSRLLVVGLVLVLTVPAVVSGLTYTEPTPTGDTETVANVTFVGVQGPFTAADNGRILAIDRAERTVLWEYANASAGENVLYYDVDPLGDDRLLFVEEVAGESATALVVDWRRDEVLERFSVPSDTHDVDHLGGDRYVVADKYHHRAFVYDAGTERVVWEYNVSEHFAAYPAAGDAPASRPSYAGGYTHLNDVDPVDNGSAFLLSPRNFNRVVLVDRETKTTEWVLGAQNDTTILKKQHNPTLLARDPPVVLVADSENDRVVEYRRTGGGWERTWEYRNELIWPRDADRLPNGNTLIVDSQGQRVLEVTPERDIVWERRVTTMPYDAERRSYGEEPRGPAIDAVGDVNATGDTDETSVFRELYALSLWFVPSWVGFGEFYGLVAAGALALVWTGVELTARLRRWRRTR